MFKVTQVRISRKVSSCYWCNQLVNIGDAKTTVASVFMGDFHFSKFHPECWQALLRWQTESKEYDEWPEPGTNSRPFVETYPKLCCECGSMDLAWDLTPHTSSGTVDGRLRMHEISVRAVLGCRVCFCTCKVTDADTFLKLLNINGPGRC